MNFYKLILNTLSIHLSKLVTNNNNFVIIKINNNIGLYNDNLFKKK